MITGKTFIYIRTPKTGSTFVATMLSELAKARPDLEIVDHRKAKHFGIAEVTGNLDGRELVTNIRDPFEHYLSSYNYSSWAKNTARNYYPDRVRRRFPDFPKIGMRDYIEFRADWRLARLELTGVSHLSDPDYLTKHRIGRFTWRVSRSVNTEPYRALERMIDEGAGLDNMAPCPVRFLRTEHLSSDCAAWFADLGAPDRLIRKVGEADRILPKRGGRVESRSWEEFLTLSETRALLETERFVLRRFPEYLPAPLPGPTD